MEMKIVLDCRDDGLRTAKLQTVVWENAATQPKNMPPPGPPTQMIHLDECCQLGNLKTFCKGHNVDCAGKYPKTKR